MKRVFGLALCVVLIAMASCSLISGSKEVDPSSLKDSGGTPPAQADAIPLAEDFIGQLMPSMASRISGGKASDLKEALRLYLLSKTLEPKADSSLMRHSTLKVTIDTDTPMQDEGTLKLKGSVEGKIPYDLLREDSLEPSTAYTDITHILLTLDLNSGEMTNIELSPYTTVHGILKDSIKLTAEPSFTTDASAEIVSDSVSGPVNLTLKMSDGFSVLCDDGTGFKCTIFSDSKAETTITDGDMAAFLQQIEITLKVYDDANNPIDEKTYTLDQMMT